jgi:DNA-binding NtrC family response regulator
MERAVVLAQGTTITVHDLSLEEQESPVVPDTRDSFVLPANATLAEIEREAIIQALQRNQGNRQAAARQLAIGAATLYRKFKTYKESGTFEVLPHC